MWLSIFERNEYDEIGNIVVHTLEEQSRTATQTGPKLKTNNHVRSSAVVLHAAKFNCWYMCICFEPNTRHSLMKDLVLLRFLSLLLLLLGFFPSSHLFFVFFLSFWTSSLLTFSSMGLFTDFQLSDTSQLQFYMYGMPRLMGKKVRTHSALESVRNLKQVKIKWYSKNWTIVKRLKSKLKKNGDTNGHCCDFKPITRC